MISVSIFINNRRIVSRYAVNQQQTDAKGRTLYKMDDGTTLHHDPADGAITLAQLMLFATEEPPKR